MTVFRTSCGKIVKLFDPPCLLGNVDGYSLYADPIVGVQYKRVGVDIADYDLIVIDGNDALIRKHGVGISFEKSQNDFNNGSAVTSAHFEVGVPTRIDIRTFAAFEFNICIVAVILIIPISLSVRIDFIGNRRNLSAFGCSANAANAIFFSRFGFTVHPSAPSVRERIGIHGALYHSRISAT